MTKINNLKRQKFKSRTSLKRKFEYADSKVEKRRKLENETEGHFLHNLLKETLFTNAKKCFRCLSNLNIATEVSDDHPLFTEGTMDFQAAVIHRRLGQLWICKFCNENNPLDLAERSTTFEFKASITSDGRTVFSPKLIAGAEEEEVNRHDENDWDEEEPLVPAPQEMDVDPASKISFPVGYEEVII